MSTPKTLVIYHRADFDGIFCCEIARKFLGDADVKYIGWDHKDQPLPMPLLSGIDRIYILDLPIDRVFGFKFEGMDADHPENHGFLQLCARVIWIDHHKSSIETHPASIAGYRIDGVAACRLTWQWFVGNNKMIQRQAVGELPLPAFEDFLNRKVSEPWAVRLAGEYDIWDKRDPNAELFQHGLRSRELDATAWALMLDSDRFEGSQSLAFVDSLLSRGQALQYAAARQNESIILDLGFTYRWEGLTFLVCNHARYNSHLFTAGLKPEHDACMGFKYLPRGEWEFSLYHAPGKEQHDLSVIAKKHGGGGHRGACGFRLETLPWMEPAASHFETSSAQES